MISNRSRWLFITIIIGLSGLWWVSSPVYMKHAMVVSVSSDGRYAISSHRNNRLVLWDLDARKQRVISHKANIYSAYFPASAEFFLWQDLEGTVRTQRITGEVLDQFNHFDTYGHVITADRQHYLSSNDRWHVYKGQGDSLAPIKRDADSPSFWGIGKLLNLTVYEEKCLLLMAGDNTGRPDMTPPVRKASQGMLSNYAGVTLWNFCTGDPLFKLPGNSAKTHATLSPDGRYAISVDENRKTFIWNTETGKRAYIIAGSFNLGQYIGGGEFGDPDNWNNDGAHLDYPNDFPKGFHGGSMVAIQFISNTQYLTFYYNQPYSILWQLGDPFAHAILPLGTDHFPSVNAYARNASIVTAPQAHRLVTGQRDGGGINVYDFDPDTQTLTPVWTPRLNPFWWPF